MWLCGNILSMGGVLEYVTSASYERHYLWACLIERDTQDGINEAYHESRWEALSWMSRWRYIPVQLFLYVVWTPGWWVATSKSCSETKATLSRTIELPYLHTYVQYL